MTMMTLPFAHLPTDMSGFYQIHVLHALLLAKSAVILIRLDALLVCKAIIR